MNKESGFYMNEQLVVVTFDNTEDYLYKFMSKEPITVEKVSEYFIKKHGFDKEVDNFVFVNKPLKIRL